jgi:hypothetical protein
MDLGQQYKIIQTDPCHLLVMKGGLFDMEEDAVTLNREKATTKTLEWRQ